MPAESAEDSPRLVDPFSAPRSRTFWDSLPLSIREKGKMPHYSPPRVIVMIPSLNEGQTIASVISAIPRELSGVADLKVLVIDDGSHDDTSRAATGAGADVIIRHKSNLGLGHAFKTGLEASLRLGGDIIVNIDADGQYDANEIPLLLQPILEGRSDIVLGDRQIKRLSHMPKSRKWGNGFASWIVRRLSGLEVRDAQTGFRALTADAALRLSLSGGFTYTQEMIIQAAHRGLTIMDVPITFRRRSDGDSRLITSLWGYAIRASSMILRSYRDQNPLRVFSIVGGIFLAVGGLFGLRVLIHFLSTGMVTPLFPSALLAAILGVIGSQVVVFGLLADMIKTTRQITEETLLHFRRREEEFR